MYRYPQLVEYKIDQVFDIMDKEGLLLYQAHPCREHLKCTLAKYLHGVEVYNGNPRHDSHNDRAMSFAERNSLLKISGSDFHQIEDLGRGGIYLPNVINENAQLISYLCDNDVKLFKRMET